MRFLAPLALIALTACANPAAPPNPNSVPNIILSITQTRAGPAPYIYMTGGIYDGAAVGQTATFVATPDNNVVCTFQTDPVLPSDGGEIVVTGHRINVPGIYGQLAGAALPNVGAIDVEYTTNFTVEAGSAGGATTTQTGFGDPRFDRITDVFAANPTPCWSFG